MHIANDDVYSKTATYRLKTAAEKFISYSFIFFVNCFHYWINKALEVKSFLILFLKASDK